MNHANDKVGSSTTDAGHMVGKNDFGAKETDVIERNYVSEETKRNDKGGGIERSGVESRTSGVGGNEGGPGNSSGGDFDVDNDSLVGIGDKNQQRPKVTPTAAKPGDRPTMDPPVIDTRNPTSGGVHDNDSSTSAADVNNETQQTGNSFKGDVTADEAAGQK